VNVTPLELPEILLVEPDVFRDRRGHFFESWRSERYADVGMPGPFVQDNVSVSSRGVLRGLHYQWPNVQGKLISVLHGAVYDVAVDVRRESPTFGRWVSQELSAKNGRQLWIPPGFAHGFVALSDDVVFHYKVTAPYTHNDEVTVAWNDPDIAIAWPMENPVLGARDASAPRLLEIPQDRLPTISRT
jgi:dTDP-4-dehydrorhamnose 3,5-epimerase